MIRWRRWVILKSQLATLKEGRRKFPFGAKNKKHLHTEIEWINYGNFTSSSRTSSDHAAQISLMQGKHFIFFCQQLHKSVAEKPEKCLKIPSRWWCDPVQKESESFNDPWKCLFSFMQITNVLMQNRIEEKKFSRKKFRLPVIPFVVAVHDEPSTSFQLPYSELLADPGRKYWKRCIWLCKWLHKKFALNVWTIFNDRQGASSMMLI